MSNKPPPGLPPAPVPNAQQSPPRAPPPGPPPGMPAGPPPGFQDPAIISAGQTSGVSMPTDPAIISAGPQFDGSGPPGLARGGMPPGLEDSIGLADDPAIAGAGIDFLVFFVITNFSKRFKFSWILQKNNFLKKFKSIILQIKNKGALLHAPAHMSAPPGLERELSPRSQQQQKGGKSAGKGTSSTPYAQGPGQVPPSPYDRQLLSPYTPGPEVGGVNLPPGLGGPPGPGPVPGPAPGFGPTPPHLLSGGAPVVPPQSSVADMGLRRHDSMGLTTPQPRMGPQLEMPVKYDEEGNKVDVLPTNLCELVDQKVVVQVNDGRTILGFLRSFDNFANLVLEHAVERHILDQFFSDLHLGCMLIRGENVVLVAEYDEFGPMVMTPIPLPEMLAKQDQLAKSDNLKLNWNFIPDED